MSKASTATQGSKAASILSIAKYLPAVPFGVLLLAWTVCGFVILGVRVPRPDGRQGNLYISCAYASLMFGFEPSTYVGDKRVLQTYKAKTVLSRWWPGRLLHADRVADYGRRFIFLPMPALVALFLPLGIGPFIRYRYPLWSYFGFTGLIAAGLAYYLR